MMKLSTWDWVALVFVIVGSLNIGLSELGFNLLNMVFGSIAWLSMTVNYLIGISALYLIYYLTKVK